ncbi:MAG TPA: hypothetical protein DHH42_06895 [Clostridiales bacterium]|nr:hypothetical protein [Clostridiales bacterium]
MLTLLKNIERFNKRYNKKRGSAMLMVLMTMAIIIVVGTSMLFVTLSSFSNSIADTQQERAYNAALTVSDTLKGSTQLNTIIETYFTKIKENGSAEVQFYNDTDFDNQAVNYTIVNGVKVYVTLSKSPSSSANKIDKVLVDIKGVKGSQESTVSFEADSVPDGTSTTIQDTFGNSFVVSNNMGSEKTSPYQIFKRIEGDVSINCFETENGERVMKTRLFNPLVLEGVTGSIYANGDLIIGAVDNMIRVQGNVYVDGNLTIRGLELGGVNLPGLMKKYYNKKYIHYWTYSKTIVGSVMIPFTKAKIVERNGSNAILGEAMYENYGDEANPQYRPIQVYDKISHYTLMDKAGDANEYTFWTRNWENGGAAEQVTITLRVKDQNGIWQNIDADYNQGGINNAQYLGASMYYDQECSKPIVQFPEGGNIYCSGDIIFDTVNYGYVYTYDAGGINTGATDGEVGDDNTQSGTPDLGALGKWLEDLKGSVINTKYDYYSLSYNSDGTKDGRIPVQTYIGGNVYCQGRMIIAPDSNTSYVNYKKVEKLGISTYFSNPDIYIGSEVVKNDKFVLKDSGAFLSQIKDKWEEILGEDKEWGDPIVINPVTIDTALNRFNYNNGTVSENPNAMKSFIEAYKEAYKKLKTEGKTIERLKEKFEDLDKDGYSYLTGDDYTEFGGKYYDPKSEKEKDAKNIAGFNTPKFNETSNLYIQNSPIRKGTSCGDIEHKNSNNIDPCTLEKYASEDKYRVVQNVDEKDKDGKPVTTRTVVNSYYLDVQKVDGKSVTTKKVIGSISYTAALSVRYCTITVNDVFCDGTISVLSSDIKDENKKVNFVNSAAVIVKNNYFCSDSVKNELKKASIMEFLKYVLQKNNAQLTDEEILKEYFGVDKNNNNFKAETKLYFDMQNKYNNSETSNEWWAGLWNTGVEITHNRKFIVLRAHMELTETAKWTNKPYVVAHEKNWNDKNAEHYTFYENWSNPEYSNSGWRYVWDLLYCLEDNNDYDGSYNGKKDLAGKIINVSNGEEVKYKDLWDNEKAAVDLIRASVDGKINTVNLVDAVFLDYQSGKEFEKSVYDDYVKKGLLEGYTNDPSAADAKFPKHKEEYKITHEGQSGSWFSDECKHKWKYYDSAEKSHTVYYYFGLKPFEDITGGSELAGLDKLSYVLSGADILRSAFLNTGYLIAMFSNGANDFDGIINGLVNGSAIIGGKLKTFGKGSTSNQFDAMKGTTRAFSEGLYGMYLVVDNRYSLVDNTATVKAIFEEIKSPEFATVVEANANQEQSKANVRKILADLQDKGDIEEYNAFDIYGDTYSGETQAGKTKDYVCAKGGKLTKKKFKISFSEPTNAESWTKVGALWCYIESSNDVEDSGSLRLMDFYNKDVENGKHLRADSTFAIDEKYNETFTGLKDKKTEILKGNFTSLTVNRSEVQYTIEQNTYFNFGLSKKEIVFAASTDGVDKRVRMNFLIDTSKKDIYIFFYCPALDTTKSKEEQIRFVFNKCSFQVTGKNNAYLMLVDDTSFAANAHSMEISNSLGSEDKTDEKVGTHFKSNTYQQYVAKLKGDGIKYTYNIIEFFESFVDDLLDATQMQALPKGDPKKVGNMFIIGMGSNNIKFGRGGTVNALIYIPHGRYSNESSGILSIIPIASSGNNEASIIAKDIYIGGSNRGKLIFTSYDVSRMGTKNSNSSGLVMDSLINPDTVSHDTKWVAGDYYYG